MRYISRSSHESFRHCMRAGYWRYLSGPYGDSPTLGLEPHIMEKPLALGICWHKGAELLLKGRSGSEAGSTAVAEAEKYESLGPVEKNWLLAACLGWERTKAEEFFAQYEVLSVEQEIETALSPNVILQSRADGIIQERNSGAVYILNWKTTSKDLKDFNRQWRFDIQSWTEALAVEGQLGIPVAGTLYYGIYKGPIWNGNMTSRLVYGYKDTLPSGSVIYQPDYKAGLKRFEVWKESFPFGDGVSAWVSWLPSDFVARHFTMAPPQMRNDLIVEKWLRQLVRKEADIDHILETGSKEDAEDFFEQHFGEHCERCPFVNFCTMRSTPEEMLREGLLRARVDHHASRGEEE